MLRCTKGWIQKTNIHLHCRRRYVKICTRGNTTAQTDVSAKEVVPFAGTLPRFSCYIKEVMPMENVLLRRKDAEMLILVVSIVGIAVSVISIIVTLISIRQTTKLTEQQKSNLPAKD